MTVTERITALRKQMKEKGIDAYLVPTDDFHGSEYVGDYFKCRKYITGFTGSAGTAVIMQDMAGLWTDGRYFIQAAQQLEGTPVTLFKIGEPDVPTIHKFLEENLKKGMCLGFDGRTVSAEEAETLEKILQKKQIRFLADPLLVMQRMNRMNRNRILRVYKRVGVKYDEKNCSCGAGSIGRCFLQAGSGRTFRGICRGGRL